MTAAVTLALAALAELLRPVGHALAIPVLRAIAGLPAAVRDAIAAASRRFRRRPRKTGGSET